MQLQYLDTNILLYIYLLCSPSEVALLNPSESCSEISIAMFLPQQHSIFDLEKGIFCSSDYLIENPDSAEAYHWMFNLTWVSLRQGCVMRSCSCSCFLVSVVTKHFFLIHHCCAVCCWWLRSIIYNTSRHTVPARTHSVVEVWVFFFNKPIHHHGNYVVTCDTEEQHWYNRESWNWCGIKISHYWLFVIA